MNKNLKNLQAYEVKIISPDLKRLHANESSTPILPIEILQKNVFKNLNYYPENQLQQLGLEAQNFYKINEKFITATNGSDEGLELIVRALCNPKDKCVVLNPTFSMYQLFCNAFGLKTFEFNLNNQNFTLDIDKFIKFCTSKKPKIIFIPNPIAPSAALTKSADLIKIIKKLPETFVVIDEAYIEFSREEGLIELVSKYKNLIVTRTLSKFFGLAGVRVGFVFSNHKKEISKIKTPYNVNAISAKIAINLFQNLTPKIIGEKQAINEEKRKNLVVWLNKFDEVDEVYESYSNFIFFKTKCDGEVFAKKLLKQGLKIKAFGGEFKKFCRITVE
jgi:histidinol-phosphate aminotransferase